MIQIDEEEKIETKVDIQEKRKIVVDKTMPNGPLELRYKPVKLNVNEINKLGLENGELKIITLSYVKDDGQRDEFVLGNLTDVELKNGKEYIVDEIKKFNSQLEQNYKNTSSLNKKMEFDSILEKIKNDLDKYKTEYTPESYEFFNGFGHEKSSKEIFISKKSVSVITVSENVNNLEVYDDITIESPFNSEKYYESKEKIENTIIDDLKEYTNSDEEIVLNLKQRYEYKDYDEISKYLEKIDNDEKLVDFFESNPDILKHIIETRPEYKEVMENNRKGKININEESFARVIFKAAIKEISKDPELMKNVVMPEKKEDDSKQER